MNLSKTNLAVVLFVGFVNYLEWAVVITSIYPYIDKVSVMIVWTSTVNKCEFEWISLKRGMANGEWGMRFLT